MAMTADEIATLLSREGSGLTPDEHDETPESAGVRQRRTELLAPVLDTCQQLWYSGSHDIDLIAEKLGDGSRDVGWRIPFGDSGILAFFLKVIASDELRPALQRHTLRLVGNSCADTDENRARMTEGDRLLFIIRRLGEETLIPFTVPVLYNILVDYEPAQLLASKSKLNQYLTALLSSPNLTNYAPFVTYICKLLNLLITQESEAAVADLLTVDTLLNLATNPPLNSDLDDFISLASAAAAYLGKEPFQKGIIAGHSLGLLLRTILHAHTAFELSSIDDPDTETSLKQLHSSLLQALADVTGHDAFPTYHPLGTEVPQTLLSWLRNPNPSVVSAACLALGNLARSDEISTALVHTYEAHTSLINLITDPATNSPQVLHSALSFLKNLAIPGQNKQALANLLKPQCVPRIYSLDTLPQVQFAAISLTRLLILNCPANAQRICLRLSDDESSSSYDCTNVTSICSLFDRTDAEPTKLEAARAVATLCRVLHSNSAKPILSDWDPERPHGSGDDSKRREYFYSKHRLAEPLAFLVTQEKWPILRSEAWFVFALMCRSKDGGRVILSVTSNERATGAIIEAVTGRRTNPGEAPAQLDDQSSGAADAVVPASTGGVQLEPQQVDPAQKADMARVDRENVVVLCQEMLRNWADEMPQLRLSMWHDLIKEGTEMIATERAQRVQTST